MISRLPAKRARQKMGAREPEQRVFPRHRKFVRSYACCVPHCDEGPIEFAHVKSRGAGGHDCFGVSLCRRHHKMQHDIGIETFQAKFGIDLWALADIFAKASPDTAMKEAMRALETP